MSITASNWRPISKNTLEGFLDLELRLSGPVLKECSVHRKDTKRWVGLPSRPQLGPEGRHRTDPTTGKRLYVSIVEIAGKTERERFQTAALAAVDALLARSACHERI
jgi:hypothetical protein